MYLRTLWCYVSVFFVKIILTLLYLVEGLTLWDWPFGLTNYCPSVLDTVGWVIWPVKIVHIMTYNVFGGTLNPTLLYLGFIYNHIVNFYYIRETKTTAIHDTSKSSNTLQLISLWQMVPYKSVFIDYGPQKSAILFFHYFSVFLYFLPVEIGMNWSTLQWLDNIITVSHYTSQKFTS